MPRLILRDYTTSLMYAVRYYGLRGFFFIVSGQFIAETRARVLKALRRRESVLWSKR